jgi:hypothetical protein
MQIRRVRETRHSKADFCSFTNTAIKVGTTAMSATFCTYIILHTSYIDGVTFFHKKFQIPLFNGLSIGKLNHH